jgi:hypothetical protein
VRDEDGPELDQAWRLGQDLGSVELGFGKTDVFLFAGFFFQFLPRLDRIVVHSFSYSSSQACFFPFPVRGTIAPDMKINIERRCDKLLAILAPLVVRAYPHFLNCIGALDGTHMHVSFPPNEHMR